MRCHRSLAQSIATRLSPPGVCAKMVHKIRLALHCIEACFVAACKAGSGNIVSYFYAKTTSNDCLTFAAIDNYININSYKLVFNITNSL